MSWWKTALFDTCSLITLDKMLQDRPSLSRWFPKKLLALEASLSADQMQNEIAERMWEIVELCPLPTPNELSNLLSSAGLSKALSEVDKLVFSTAVHFKLSVVTGDKRLAKSIQHRVLDVGNMPLILQELATTKKLKSSSVEKILRDLANRKDYLLGMHNPTLNDLKAHTFPG